jgi:hypothetical protein
MTAWIGIIGTVIGAIVGGGLTLLNAHLQTRRQAQQDRRKLILSKLEELYEAISHFRFMHHELFLQLMTEGPNAGGKVEARERRGLLIDRILMLVGFYAPELSKHHIATMKEAISFMDTAFTYAAAKKLGEAQDKNTVDTLWSNREKLDDALALMLMELENVSKKYM